MTEREKKPCGWCGGHGCRKCRSTGEQHVDEPCALCGGKGTDEVGTACAGCHGRGTRRVREAL